MTHEVEPSHKTTVRPAKAEKVSGQVAMRASTIPESPRPIWLPKGATLVKAAGEPCDVSLEQEYADAPKERIVAFEAEMARISEAEARAWRDTQGIILR